MDKFLMWALVIFVVMILIFSKFTISITNDGDSMGLINNKVSQGGILPSITKMFGGAAPTEPRIGVPQGAKFYAPKCG